MGKIITGLRELGSKMTGSEITSNRIGDAIKEIASKYTGGGGGAELKEADVIFYDGDFWLVKGEHHDYLTYEEFEALGDLVKLNVSLDGANITAYPIGKIDQMELFNEAGFDFAMIREEGLFASTAKVYVED